MCIPSCRKGRIRTHASAWVSARLLRGVGLGSGDLKTLSQPGVNSTNRPVRTDQIVIFEHSDIEVSAFGAILLPARLRVPPLKRTASGESQTFQCSEILPEPPSSFRACFL